MKKGNITIEDYSKLRVKLKSENNIRDLIVFEMLGRLDLSLEELSSLRLSDIHLNFSYNSEVMGDIKFIRGNTEVTQFIDRELFVTIDNYINFRKYKYPHTEYLIVSQKGKYSRSGLHRKIKKWFKEMNYTTYSCRSLRNAIHCTNQLGISN